MTTVSVDEYTVEMFLGDSKKLLVTVVNQNGVEQDVSNDRWVSTFKVNADDAAYVIQKTSDDPNEIERPYGGNNAKGLVKIIPGDTQSEEPGELVFDVEITRAADSGVHTVVKGVLTLNQDVTN